MYGALLIVWIMHYNFYVCVSYYFLTDYYYLNFKTNFKNNANFYWLEVINMHFFCHVVMIFIIIINAKAR